jgi:hypothetical protein
VEPVAVAVHDVRRARIAAGNRVVVVGGGRVGVRGESLTETIRRVRAEIPREPWSALQAAAPIRTLAAV